nr:hypothetical protein [Mucilaginibacter sp. X5P1]
MPINKNRTFFKFFIVVFNSITIGMTIYEENGLKKYAYFFTHHRLRS